MAHYTISGVIKVDSFYSFQEAAMLTYFYSYIFYIAPNSFFIMENIEQYFGFGNCTV